MKRLTLIRHAKSDWNSSAKTDFDRPLNARGKQNAPLMGRRLAARGPHPDRLISSPAKRARQTAKKIAREIGYPEKQIDYEPRIYEASRATLIAILRNLDDRFDEVILCGHNPGFSELGEWLTPEASEWLPTCGLLELELQIDSWATAAKECAKLSYYDYPKKDA